MEADNSGGNVPDGNVLNGFAEGIMARDKEKTDRYRKEIVGTLGEAALADSAAVIAGFNMVARVADATGLPLEDYKEEASGELREQLGLNALSSNLG